MSEFALQSRRRTTLVLGFLFLAALAITGRLVSLQVIQHEKMRSYVQDEVVRKIILHANRGRIYDSTGRPLALNENGHMMWVDGKYFKAYTPEAARLFSASCNRLSSENLALVIASQSESFLLCSRWVEREDAAALAAMIKNKQLRGVLLKPEPKRVYPYGSLTATVLGHLQDDTNPSAVTNTAYIAVSGVEAYHNDLLRGTDGLLHMEGAPDNYMIPFGEREEQPPQEGANITLTLDLNIQYAADQLLTEAVQNAGGRRGDIVVLNPKTGAILAMATYPSYEPTKIAECFEDPLCIEALYRHSAVGLHYNPGSTMKILTVAIALEEHLVYPGWAFDCAGAITVGNTRFNNWDGNAHGYETLDQILLHSCNVGAVTLGMMIPNDTYYRYLDRLGFGRLTGVDIAGEVRGDFRTPDHERWTITDKASNAFGQSIDATPLQLIAAISAVANGGNVYQPYITQSIERDGVITTTLPIVRSRVFSSEVSREVTAMLVAVGDSKGERGGPLVPGYQVALKTGTSSIPLEDGSGHDLHRTIASAVGYAPAHDPRFIILVRIEGRSTIWGEGEAVPVLGKLTTFLLAYMNIPPQREAAAAP